MSTNPFVYPPELTKDGWVSAIRQGLLCRIDRDSSFHPDSIFPAETSPATI